jgi:hypothetical protein
MLEAGPEHAHSSSVVNSSHDEMAALHEKGIAANTPYHIKPIRKVSRPSHRTCNVQLDDIEWDFGSDDENQGVKTIEESCTGDASVDDSPGMVQVREDISVSPLLEIITSKEERHVNEEVPYDSSSEFETEVVLRDRDLTSDFLERERKFLADAPPLLIKESETLAKDSDHYNHYDSFKGNGDMYEGGENRRYQGSIHSDSDCDSHGSPVCPESRISLTKRKTLDSSSGSDVALHEGAELSEDDQQSGIFKSRFALIAVIAIVLLIKALIGRTSVRK